MNSESTLKAIELAHKILKDKMIDNNGELAVNDKFFIGLDKVLFQLQETRKLAETLR